MVGKEYWHPTQKAKAVKEGYVHNTMSKVRYRDDYVIDRVYL